MYKTLITDLESNLINKEASALDATKPMVNNELQRRSNQARWLFHIHNFIEFVIQENIVDIHLFNFPTMSYGNAENNMYDCGFHNGLKVS